MAGHVRTMRISVIYNNKFIMWDMTLRMTPIIPCEMFCNNHLNIIRVISLIGISRGRFDVHGCAL